MTEFVDPVILREVLGRSLREAIRLREMTLGDAAQAVGVLPTALQAYLNGRRLPRTEVLLRIRRYFGIQLELHTDQFRVRQTRASRVHACAICSTTIREGSIYYRDESSGSADLSTDETVRHLCRDCIKPYHTDASARGHDSLAQLSLPIADPLTVVETRVELVDITRELAERIVRHPDEIYSITPRQFEDLIADRLRAMNLDPIRVGDTYRKDGGVDIVFCANRQAPFPFLGAVQVKHHREPSVKVGPGPVRELGGVLCALPFAAGLIVTNTSFTADALWAAKQQKALIRLRDFDDLIRWLSYNFTDDADWRELPKEIELCPGVRIQVKL